MERRSREGGQIGAVVHNEQGLSLVAHTGDPLEVFENRARKKPFVTELKNLRSPFEDLLCGTHRIDSAATGNLGVEYRIKPGYAKLRPHAKAPDPDPACRAGRIE